MIRQPKPWTILIALLCMVASLRRIRLTTAAEFAIARSEDDEGGSDELILESLNDEELETICTSRGFELVREEPKEGEEPAIYTHEDYVDAARQCLQIEEEMNEVIRDNPETLEQLKVEAERMQQEQNQLEAQKTELEAELAKAMQQQKEISEKQDAENGGTFGLPSDDSSENANQKQEEEAASPSNDEAPTIGDPDYVMEPNMGVRELLYEVVLQVKRDINMVLAPVRTLLQHPVAQELKESGSDLIQRLNNLPAMRNIKAKGEEALKPFLNHPTVQSIASNVIDGVKVVRKYAIAIIVPHLSSQDTNTASTNNKEVA